jgi:ubiquinone/menaquinone biosynthesis C-methylase UbiE
MRTLLRFFFRLLYHPFAFAYDLVAATVSVGRWNDWVASVLPFLSGTHILELGSGPGHLQRLLHSRNLLAVAIDESAPMLRLAQRNLRRGLPSGATPHPAYAQTTLTRGLAQHLPFADSSFDTVVATFPAEYITDPRTLSEVKRCLSDGGRFVVLPVALQLGRNLLERMMALLFRVTGQTPANPLDELKARLEAPFREAGFEVAVEEVRNGSSLLLVVVAARKEMT